MSPLHFNLTDRGTSPAPVPSPGAGVSICKVVVVAMGAISTAVAIAERYGPHISCPNYGQSPEDHDGGDWQHVHNFLPRKGLVYQFGAALGDPRLCQIKIRSVWVCYYTLLHIITDRRVQA